MDKRNRAQGWKHAKLSGHENEKNMKELLQSNDSGLRDALKGYSEETISSVEIGGLNEKDVPCILGRKTKSKTDCVLVLGEKAKYNISIKKSKGGQAYLITTDRFMRGFEAQMKLIIPENVKRAIHLFWGSAADTLETVAKHGVNKEYENYKKRVVGNTLNAYDGTLYNELLAWFTKYAVELFDFCFSKGLSAESKDWAELLWFKNTLGENDLNEIFNIEDLKKKVKKSPTATYGKIGGGTTIQLPFGFVQWHLKQMQFHYDYDKLKKLTDSEE